MYSHRTTTVGCLVRFVNVTAFSVLARNELPGITEDAPLFSRLVHLPTFLDTRTEL